MPGRECGHPGNYRVLRFTTWVISTMRLGMARERFRSHSKAYP